MSVSRETSERFERLAELALKWNPAINLISKSTVHDIHRRHIQDSAQIYSFAPEGVSLWVDMGSGGGFPGLVISILAQEMSQNTRVILIESDRRKCEFLRHASRDLGLTTEVIDERIEAVSPLGADVVSARALAPLVNLCDYFDRHSAKHGLGLFPKGSSHAQELAEAKLCWSMDCKAHTSITDPASVIFELKDVSRV